LPIGRHDILSDRAIWLKGRISDGKTDKCGSTLYEIFPETPFPKSLRLELEPAAQNAHKVVAQSGSRSNWGMGVLFPHRIDTTDGLEFTTFTCSRFVECSVRIVLPLLRNRSKAMESCTDRNGDTWEIHHDGDGWRWRRRSVNGRIVGASSEAYRNKSDCIANAMRNA
jgi:hypothetical protein